MTVQILTGDALQEMGRLPDNSVDAVITDPPYCSGAITEAGRARASHQGLRSETIRSGRFAWFESDNMTTAGLGWLLREVALESLRVMKPSGSLCLFCDWRMVPTLAPAIESAGLLWRNMVVWDKRSFGMGQGFRHQHEIILHFSGSSPAFHAADIGNVIAAGRVRSDDRDHPTEKPIDLMRKLIRVASPVGGTILDPFAGSGTTGVAAKAEGRSAVLIERDPAYAAVAQQRVDGGVSPVERARIKHGAKDVEPGPLFAEAAE